MSDSAERLNRELRASDADREKVANELRAHCVDGRITIEELDKRLEGVITARTIRELAEFVYDVPTIAVPPERGHAELLPRVGPPGILPFTRRLLVPAPPGRSRDVALDTIAPALNAYGYELISQSAGGLVFERHRRSGWTMLVSLVFFPFGLLALLTRKRERIVISLEARGAGSTNLTVHGVASRRVRKAFARLTFS